MGVLLEIAVDSLADARAAERAGADRLELCGALELGGVTPTLGLVRCVTHAGMVPVVVMLRARGGDFVYSDAEMETMRADLEALCGECVAGVVFGALDAQGDVDVRRCAAVVAQWKEARAAAGPPGVMQFGARDEAARWPGGGGGASEAAVLAGQLVFHRAFDRVRDPSAALEQIIALGFTRVLTSGQAPSAADPAGVERLARLRAQAAGRIEILPGGRVRPGNVAALLRATGCTQVHSACRGPDGRLDEHMVVEMRRIVDALDRPR